MDSEELYTLDLGNTEKYSSDDLNSRMKLVSQHRQLFQEFLAGIRKSDDISDLVSDYGLDPDDYWDIVNNNISRVITKNKSIDDAQWLLQKLKRLQNNSS